MVSGLVLFVGVTGLLYLAQSFGAGLMTQTRLDLTYLPFSELTIVSVRQLFTTKCVHALSIAGALIGALFAATLTVNLAQIGFHFNFDRITMNWDRIGPYHFDRLLSWNKMMRGLMMVVKISAVATVAWWVLRRRGSEIAYVNQHSLSATLAHGWTLAIWISLTLAGTLLLIGVIDYTYQPLGTSSISLYMSKQELKDEMKREEGNPQIKARVRKLQRENARRKMFHKVASATVVVTNPTHLAIALQYDAGVMKAPKVIAKGAGHVAKRIVMLARKNGVPVVERKPLAQALYKTVKIDQDIPLGLYYVVAELMAYVYQLKGGPPAATKTAAQ